MRSYSIVKEPIAAFRVAESLVGWTHFGFAMCKPSLNRLLTRAAQKVVTGTQARTPVLRGDLNLKEVGKGRASPAGNLLPFETLAEVDFNSCRPADTVCGGQAVRNKP